MVKIKRYDFSSKSISEIDFDEKIFGDRARVRCLRGAVIMYAANRRQGTVQTKERSDVRGTTKKPWKQKHTGRARAGSAKSPIWRGGGTIFGPHPRDYGYKLPRRELLVALRGALFGKFTDREVTLVANLDFAKPSAKLAREMFLNLAGDANNPAGKSDAKKRKGAADKAKAPAAEKKAAVKSPGTDLSCLVVLPEHNETAWNSMRNFPKVSVKTAADVNADDILRNRLVLMTVEAADKLKNGYRGIAITEKAVGAK
ncbi:MAG: 50S ribosomal protein L4 [Planctomycetes bacterium]|nr:50S ribosomal protein L4 [Planctomycetota bacterium]